MAATEGAAAALGFLSTNSSRHQFGKHGSKLFGTKNIKPKLGPDQTDITSYPNQTSPLKSSIQFSPTQTGLIQKNPLKPVLGRTILRFAWAQTRRSRAAFSTERLLALVGDARARRRPSIRRKLNGKAK
jgi:hypothetical protein